MPLLGEKKQCTDMSIVIKKKKLVSLPNPIVPYMNLSSVRAMNSSQVKLGLFLYLIPVQANLVI